MRAGRAAVGRPGPARGTCNDVALPAATVALCTSTKPASESLRRNRAAPSNASTLRHRWRYSSVGVAGVPPPRRDDDAPADRSPGPHRGPRIPHRVLVHPKRRAGPQQFEESLQLPVRIGQVAHEVGRQDAVEWPLDAEVGDVLDVTLDESHRRRPRLRPRLTQHPLGRVDRDDLGVRRRFQQRGGRRARAAPRVEQT